MSPPHESTILLIERDPDLCRLGTEYLRARGYTVIATHNAEDGLRQVINGELKVDLLITDMGVNDMSGMEAAKLLRQRHPMLRIVYVSGFGPSPNHEVSANDMFLSKPYGLTHLGAVVAGLLETWVPG